MVAIDKTELLSTHYLFRDLPGDVIDHIIKLGINRKLSDHETLFLKGDPGDALYGVLAGRVRISASAASGKEIILSIVEPGDVFGEIALLDGMDRTADATAVGATELFRINRREFMEFLHSQPKLATHLLRMVCERVRSTNEFVEDYVFMGLSARLAKRILTFTRYYEETGAEDISQGFKISQSELAQLMGTTRETINRQLQVWRKDGLIDLPRGRIKVLAPEALEEVVLSGAE